MISPIYTLSPDVPPPNIKEIRRYADCKDGADVPLGEVLEETNNLTYKVACRELDIKITGEEIDFGFTKIISSDLAKNLKNSEKVIIFAATVGILPDKMIKKYSVVSPVKALFWQAVGTERVEALCDEFSTIIADEYQKKGYKALPRFSPGYGDLPLEMQTDIMSLLECNKTLGITLNDSLLMTPSKSVTAIIGLSK